MKKLFILAFCATFSVFLLASCQNTPSTQKGNQITIKQVNPDGTEKIVMQGGDKNNPKDSKPNVLPNVKGIAITADGFAPSQLPPVKKGVKLMLQNTDEKAHLLEVDKTVENNACADFNPGKELKKGEIYEYVFTTPGECSFNDTVNPDMKAKITVTE